MNHKSPTPLASDWDHVGPWYDQLLGDAGGVHYQKTIIPGVIRLLDLPPGGRVLDIACGQGVLCRALAERGFDTTGVDLSPTLISAARRRQTSPTRQQYFVADARNLSACGPLTPAAFDAVICILAITNLTPLSPVWQGCHAMLKPGGRLVVVLAHPCFRIPQKSSWGWDEKTATQYRRLDGYLSSQKIPIDMHPGLSKNHRGDAPGPTTLTFHRPLQAYINTLGSAKMWVDHVDEWISARLPPPGRRQEALDRSRREFPLFLAIRARKTE